jgi:serine/threonine protein kinase
MYAYYNNTIPHQMAKSPHVAQLLGGCFVVNALPFLVYEEMDGTLRDLLASTTAAPSFGHRVGILLSVIVCGIALQRNRVVHGDIKDDNILMKDGIAFLGDFGVAQASDGTASVLTRTINNRAHYWVPPEKHTSRAGEL